MYIYISLSPSLTHDLPVPDPHPKDVLAHTQEKKTHKRREKKPKKGNYSKHKRKNEVNRQKTLRFLYSGEFPFCFFL
jgi:hypothetical protein